MRGYFEQIHKRERAVSDCEGDWSGAPMFGSDYSRGVGFLGRNAIIARARVSMAAEA